MADIKKGEGAPEAPKEMTDAEKAARIAALQAELKDLGAKPVPDIRTGVVTDETAVYAGTKQVERNGKLVEVEMWNYRIDLPPSGGQDIKLNGQSYYHGVIYPVDTDTLRVLTDIVHRCRMHEEQIRGSNENFYRQPVSKIIRGQSR